MYGREGGSEMESRIRILTVDDHPVVRDGLDMILAAQPDMNPIAQASNAAEAVSLFRKFRPDVTLMDHRLPGATGTDAVIAIRGEFPRARIVMLTTSEGDVEIQRALSAGVAAYILKSVPRDELLGVIRKVHLGHRCIPAGIATKVAEFMGSESLTPREAQILFLVRDGLRNKQIASNLAISETTVSFHIKNIVEKLQASDRTHALTIALRRGLLQM
jgi:DNA-binding NarL/FixJ family response regulator